MGAILTPEPGKNDGRFQVMQNDIQQKRTRTKKNDTTPKTRQLVKY